MTKLEALLALNDEIPLTDVYLEENDLGEEYISEAHVKDIEEALEELRKERERDNKALDRAIEELGLIDRDYIKNNSYVLIGRNNLIDHIVIEQGKGITMIGIYNTVSSTVISGAEKSGITIGKEDLAQD